jgi:hypothetical protein
MPPSNTYTVTIADAHSHSVSQSGIAAGSQLDALLTASQTFAAEAGTFAALVTTDTWTATITQP